MYGGKPPTREPVSGQNYSRVDPKYYSEIEGASGLPWMWNGTSLAYEGPGPVTVNGFTYYKGTLAEAHVVGDFYGIYRISVDAQKFVAVADNGGTSGSVTTSTDGVVWTQRTTPITTGGTGIAYGNNTFVAVNYNNLTARCQTSPDGITWTSRTGLDTAGTWLAVAFGNGVFVAVGDTGTNRCATSTDGITWTNRSITVASWRNVRFINGIFVAHTTSAVATSPDGITWTVRTGVPAGTLGDVAFGAGLYVFVANAGTNRIITTPDFVTWTSRSTNTTWTPARVRFDNGKFQAVGSADFVANSTDGINWNVETSQPIQGAFIRGITSGNGRFVAVSQNGTSLVPRHMYKLFS